MNFAQLLNFYFEIFRYNLSNIIGYRERQVMNQTIAEQALYLTDTIGLLLDKSQHLDASHLSKLEKMETKMQFFLTEYYKHSALSIAEYASYLNHDALSQLTFILGYAELFRSINAHMLTNTALDHLNVICDETRKLTENLRTERDTMVATRDQFTKH